MNEPRINRQIKSDRVKVIGKDGDQLGDMSLIEAIRAADADSLDLVEVGPKENPPVCKILDYGKYKYRLKKKTQKSKSKQHLIQVKVIKLRPRTEKHDYDFKLDHAKKFLEKGDKVKFTVFFKGRERMHSEMGKTILKKVLKDMESLIKVEQDIMMDKRIMTMVVAPR